MDNSIDDTDIIEMVEKPKYSFRKRVFSVVETICMYILMFLFGTLSGIGLALFMGICKF
jgi:hypothetical protein